MVKNRKKGYPIKTLTNLFLLLLISFSFLKGSTLQKTSVQLMWLDQFEFAGFYIAKEKGFYKEFGLDVELKKYDTSINVVDEVINKKADFGTNSSSLIIDKSNGKDIVLLGSIFQSSPLILLALKDSNLKYLEDLKNKTLMISSEQQRFATFKSMFVSKGISLNDLNIVEHNFNIDDLLNKKIDVMLAYSTNEPFLLQEKGFESTIFNPKDYGFDFYEELIFTTKELAKNNPKLVKDFYKATIKGWEYAFENIEESVKIIHEKYNSQNKSFENLFFEANEMKKLVYDKDGKIGTITPEKINLIINTYRVMGLMTNHIDVNDLIFVDQLQNGILLTKEEKDYLEKKQKIKMCIDPNWMPFEKIDNGKHIGISSDYIKIIENKINTPIELIATKTWSESIQKAKNRECDIFSLVMTTPQREKYLNFTKPLIIAPIVLAADINAPFIDNINLIREKKLAIVKDYAYAEILQIKYPDIKFILVQNVKEGLKKVEKGEIFGFIGSLPTVAYEVQNNFLGQLKITGKFDESLNLGLASRNDEPILNTILNKAVDDISSSQKQEILNKWISINYEKDVDYKLLTFVVIIIFILFLIYRQYLLKKLNKNLSKKIDLEVKKNEEKNRILIQQSRMASMGEMLENIAHQWRQPLAQVNSSVLLIDVELKKNKFENEFIENKLIEIESLTSYMSKTIDDFKNFFDPNKKKSIFKVEEAILKAKNILKGRIKESHIDLIINIEEELKIYSYLEELQQVILIILNNAIDAIILNKVLNPKILINAYSKDSKIMIFIEDNALGIEAKIIDKIFEPYFTTKQKSRGTGLGLYISKMIIEDGLNGSLDVENKKNGACFKIKIPKGEYDE